MTTISVVTIARGRLDHLGGVLAGLERQTVAPTEVVVVAMGAPEVEALAAASSVVTSIKSVACEPGEPLPLAEARNTGAEATSAELMVFLDVDCIPARTLIADYQRQMRPGLLMGVVRYLPHGIPGKGAPPNRWDDADLRRYGQLHPARPIPHHPERTDQYELFWSLNFAVERRIWEVIGGFDSAYRGYGGEDTDFAFEARRHQVEAWFVPDAEAFHQHHPTTNPPIEHLNDIVANARRFYAKWGSWPMVGWLDAFARAGLIIWHEKQIEVVDRPALARSRS